MNCFYIGLFLYCGNAGPPVAYIEGQPQSPPAYTQEGPRIGTWEDVRKAKEQHDAMMKGQTLEYTCRNGRFAGLEYMRQVCDRMK